VSTHWLLQQVLGDPQDWPPQPPHIPDAQLSPEAHVLPQLPQLLGSVWVSTHWPLHSPCPVGHLQSPFWQMAPNASVAQSWPHVPQWLASVCVSTHA
jgi:hypothetical protein